MKRLLLSLTSRSIEVFDYFRKEGYLDLNPPYQRGEVWGKMRQQNLIKSILIGIPIPSVVVNDRFSAGWGESISVIDGKQRITSILNFQDGKFAVPAEWFGLTGEDVFYSELDSKYQRRFKQTPMQVCEGLKKRRKFLS